MFTNLKLCKYNREMNTLTELHTLANLGQTVIKRLLNPAVRLVMTEHTVVYYAGLH